VASLRIEFHPSAVDEALVALDRQDQAALDELYPKLVGLDDDIDTVQPASLAADQAILEVRDARRDEGISCED
jgi:hypothetical protein